MNRYCLFTSGPIDNWGDFVHISKVYSIVFRYFRENPHHEYTYSSVWNSIMSKLHWAWCECKEVDTELRSVDVWVDLHLHEEHFECSILFKSDNNGIVNLIMDNSFGVHDRVKNIIHEFDCPWEYQVTD